jgi:hypothetical protein
MHGSIRRETESPTQIENVDDGSTLEKLACEEKSWIATFIEFELGILGLICQWI